MPDLQPRIPDSEEEGELEDWAFKVANDESVPIDARNLIAALWREIVARENWYDELY